jgi:hypothetical protein
LSILFCRFSEAFSVEFIREYERENKCDDDELCTQISNTVSIFFTTIHGDAGIGYLTVLENL